MKIYIASKTIHAPRWQVLRTKGAPIISTWIDEAGNGESDNLVGLWMRITDEVKACDYLVFYADSKDEGWKGAFVEVGMALALGKRVIVCLPGIELNAKSQRPIGSWVKHPLVRRDNDCLSALNMKVQ